MKAIPALLRAAAEAFDTQMSADAEAGLAMLRLALQLSGPRPMSARQHAEIVAPAILDREDSNFWNDTPSIEPKPETIAKALAAVPPPAAGVE